MKDANERPLPSEVPTEETITIGEFLHSVGHPPADMMRATLRFGQFAFNRYRKQFGHAPYTRRINGNGPVKVYRGLPEYQFLLNTYEQWRQRHNKETA